MNFSFPTLLATRPALDKYISNGGRLRLILASFALAENRSRFGELGGTERAEKPRELVRTRAPKDGSMQLLSLPVTSSLGSRRGRPCSSCCERLLAEFL